MGDHITSPSRSRQQQSNARTGSAGYERRHKVRELILADVAEAELVILSIGELIQNDLVSRIVLADL